MTKSQQAEATARALTALEELGGKFTSDEEIRHEGTAFVLPATMTLSEAASFLYRKADEEEESTRFARTFRFRPWDGAVATVRALKRAFGMVNVTGTVGLFGRAPAPMATISTGPDDDDTVQVPWGCWVEMPGLPGLRLQFGVDRDPDAGRLFALYADGPRRHRFAVEGIFRLVGEELATGSIYRGKAFDGQEDPQFLDLSGVSPERAVYSADTIVQLEANLWSLLRYSDAMRARGVSLKRAVLLEGPYGTGKTMAAMLTARIAVENGWTFLYCRPGRDDLEDTLQTAKLYQPAVVFFEDLDAVGNGDDEHVTRLLDAFDGMQAKGTEIFGVLTTNHVEKIHKGMLRPGRLDSVIHVGKLDAAGIRRLVESVVGDHLSGSVDWSAVADAMDGYLPAFVKEASERAMRYAIARNEGVPGTLTTEDLANAAAGLRPQFDLMHGAPESSKAATVDGAIRGVVREAVDNLHVVEAPSQAVVDGELVFAPYAIRANGKA